MASNRWQISEPSSCLWAVYKWLSFLYLGKLSNSFFLKINGVIKNKVKEESPVPKGGCVEFKSIEKNSHLKESVWGSSSFGDSGGFWRSSVAVVDAIRKIN